MGSPSSLTPAPDESEVLELLRRQIEIQKRLLDLTKRVGVAAYRPHWKQHLFHSAPHKRRGFFAGNRTGKSQSSCAETVAWAMGERVWYKVPFNIVDRSGTINHYHDGSPNHPLVRQGIPPWPTKQLIITTDWDKVDEIWTGQRGDRPGKLWQMLPQGWVDDRPGHGIRRNHSGVIDTIEGKNGALIKFDTVQSFIKDPQGSESSEWDRIAGDEPFPEEMWKASARGLMDRNGQGDFTLTALKERWIYDYFYEVAGQSENPKEGRYAVKATTYDNPFMTDEAIAAYEADLTDDEKQCRIHGIPLELSGLVYKQFEYSRHVLQSVPQGWRDYHLPPKNYILDYRIDVHPKVNQAVLFSATGPSQIPVLCHEIWAPLDATALADSILEYVNLCGLFVNTAKCEPAAWIKDELRKVPAPADMFAERGLFVSRASKDKTHGILNVQSVLKRPNGILFSPNIRRTLFEISRYRFDDKKQTPVDQDDHMMENLYRLLIDKPFWFDPDKAAGEPVKDMEITGSNLSTSDY